MAILYQPILVKIKNTMKLVLKFENNKRNRDLSLYYAMIRNILDYKLTIRNISFLKMCNSFRPLIPRLSYKELEKGGAVFHLVEKVTFLVRAVYRGIIISCKYSYEINFNPLAVFWFTISLLNGWLTIYITKIKAFWILHSIWIFCLWYGKVLLSVIPCQVIQALTWLIW